MELDGLLAFVPFGAPLSLANLAAGASVASGVIDLSGAGVGVAPPNFFGTRSVFGADNGIGRQKPQVLCTTGAAFTTGTAATLNIAFQAAVDTGVGGGYQPGTWNTLVETGYMAAANLGAAKTIARFDWPPAFPFGVLPRYLRLLFQILTATTFTAGTIAFAMPTTARDEVNFGAKNFISV